MRNPGSGYCVQVTPRLAIFVGLLLLPACLGPGNLRGSWTGGCDFSDGDYGGPIFLDLVIDRDLGRRITGDGTATLPEEGILDVTVEGERAGDLVLLEVQIPSRTGDLLLVFEGERDADELEGSCQLWVPGATAPIVGTGEIGR